MAAQEMRPDSPLDVPEENPRSMSALERKPDVPASTSDEDPRPGCDYRGILEGPLAIRVKMGPYLRPHC